MPGQSRRKSRPNKKKRGKARKKKKSHVVGPSMSSMPSMPSWREGMAAHWFDSTEAMPSMAMPSMPCHGRAKAHGQGTSTFASGSKYVGMFQNGKAHGRGTLTFPDGRTYVGMFQNGKAHGRGTLTFPSQ